MAIRGPKGAHPTLRGWVNPRTGELLKSQRINQTQIDEFFGIKEEVKPKATAQVLTEAPRNNESLDDMSKVELEALGRQHGIELDRRKRHDDLVEELEEHLDKD